MDSATSYTYDIGDHTTILQDLRTRWYDPTMGRFINEDSFEGQMDNPLSLNLYTYAWNNPLVYSDPSGNNPIGRFIRFIRGKARQSYAPVDWDGPAPNGSLNAYAAREYGRQIAIQAAKDSARVRIAEESIFKGMQIRNTISRNASEVNKELNYTHAPYKSGTYVYETQLTEKTTGFVRVYEGKTSSMKGAWVMKLEDIKGLTPKQIQDKYALPALPKYYVEITFDSGTKLRSGIAASVNGWGTGGGLQFDTRLNTEYVGTYGKEMLLPSGGLK